MRVRAKQAVSGNELYGVGYYDLKLYKGGEEFDITDGRHFSDKWMEKIVEPPVQFVEVEVDKDEPTSKKKR
jgi:hypothetical protein